MNRHEAVYDNVIIALDDMTPAEALAIAEKLKGRVWGFKIHMAFFHKEGGYEFIQALKACGKVFCDFKFHEIPNSMHGLVKNVVEMGADLVTVHASAGEAALREAYEEGGDKVIAVTQLTSDPDSSQVVPRALLAHSVGIKNIVCSAQEATAVKDAAPDVTIFSPGIRAEGADKNDQSRTATPQEAIKNRVDYVIVGRPVTVNQHIEAEHDPVAQLDALMAPTLSTPVAAPTAAPEAPPSE